MKHTAQPPRFVQLCAVPSGDRDGFDSILYALDDLGYVWRLDDQYSVTWQPSWTKLDYPNAAVQRLRRPYSAGCRDCGAREDNLTDADLAEHCTTCGSDRWVRIDSELDLEVDFVCKANPSHWTDEPAWIVYESRYTPTTQHTVMCPQCPPSHSPMVRSFELSPDERDVYKAARYGDPPEVGALKEPLPF